MKNAICLLGLAGILLTGCQYKDIPDDASSDSLLEAPAVIRAVVEDVADTKTAIEDDVRIVWSEGDEIALFNDNSYPGRYELIEEYIGGTSAEFSLADEPESGTSIGADIAFYPYSAALACDVAENGFVVDGYKFPDTYEYARNSFASGSFPMAAVCPVGEYDFSFRNIAGVLRLSFTGSHSIRSIEICGNDDEVLSGDAVIRLFQGGQVPEVVLEEGGKTVMLDCGDDCVPLRVAPVEFNIPLPPVEFKSGFTVTVTEKGGGKMTVRTYKPNPVKRSKVLSMPSVAFKPETAVGPQVTFETVSKRFDGIDVKVMASGAPQFSGGCKLKESYVASTVVREANWKIAPRIVGDFEYEGPMTGFPSGNPGNVIPGKTYVLWVAPYAEGKNTVAAGDIITKEYTVPALVSGGSISLETSGLIVGSKSVEVSLSGEGASMIYAAFLTDDELGTVTGDAISYLLDNVIPSYGDAVSLTRTSLTSDSAVTLLAVAVDEEGRYGELLETEYRTSVLTVNEDLKLSLSLNYEGRKACIGVSSYGGDVMRYYYYVGRTSDSFWKNTLGGSVASAETFIMNNYTHYNLSDTSEKPFVDGCIIVEKPDLAVEYAAVVMAMGNDGRFSHAASLSFSPEMDLGSFVLNTDSRWLASKPEVVFGECGSDGEFYTIRWSVQPKEGMTAYSLCSHPVVMSEFSSGKMKAMRIYDKGKEVVAGKMLTELYGDESSCVYVTWCDAEGNFYEPFSVSLP